jgi:hypothetical protein
MRRGAIPLATLNLMLLGNDAWHHQMIYGVEKIPKRYYSLPLSSTHSSLQLNSTLTSLSISNQNQPIAESTTEENKEVRYHYYVYPTNSLDPYEMSIFRLCITSDSFMTIPRFHVIERIRDEMQLDLLQKEPFLGTDTVDQILEIVSFEAQRATRIIHRHSTQKDNNINIVHNDSIPINTNNNQTLIEKKKETQKRPMIERRKLIQILQQAEDGDQSESKDGQGIEKVDEENKYVLSQKLVAPKYLFIPWGGLAGITLFVINGTKAHKELSEYREKHSVKVYLPAYQRDTVVCTYCPNPSPSSSS